MLNAVSAPKRRRCCRCDRPAVALCGGSPMCSKHTHDFAEQAPPAGAAVRATLAGKTIDEVLFRNS